MASTLLAVDDSVTMRKVLEITFAGPDFRVVTANSPDAALQKLKGEKIDLVITDLIMPGMGGQELARQLGERYPNVRILFTSGYTENAIIHHGRLDSGVLLLAKPYRKSDMAAMIRRALEGNRD